MKGVLFDYYPCCDRYLVTSKTENEAFAERVSSDVRSRDDFARAECVDRKTSGLRCMSHLQRAPMRTDEIRRQSAFKHPYQPELAILPMVHVKSWTVSASTSPSRQPT